MVAGERSKMNFLIAFLLLGHFYAGVLGEAAATTGCYPISAVITAAALVGDWNVPSLHPHLVCSTQCARVEINHVKRFPQAFYDETTKMCYCSDSAASPAADASLCNTPGGIPDLLMEGEGLDEETYATAIDSSKSIGEVQTSVAVGYAGEPISVTANMLQGDSALGVSYQYDFGDGMDIDSFAQNAVEKSHAFAAGGIYDVSITVKNGYTVPVVIKRKLTVYEHMRAGFDCPTPLVSEVGQPFPCVLRLLAGGGCTATIQADYEDGTAFHSSTTRMADSVISVKGSMASGSSISDQTPFEGVVLFRTLRFTQKGHLLRLFMKTTQNGPLIILIYRSMPCFPGQTYCPAKDSCESTCTTTPTLTCNDPVTNKLDQRCSATPGNDMPGKTIIAEFVVLVDGPVGDVSLSICSSDYEAQAGDVLGVQMRSDGCQIQRTSGGSRGLYYSHSFDSHDISPTLPLSGSHHFAIQAILSYSSVTVIPETPSQEGTILLESFLVDGMETFNTTVSVPVQTPITVLAITTPQPAGMAAYEIGVPMTIETSVATGSDVTYIVEVRFGADVKLTDNSTSPTVVFTPRNLGSYNLVVAASNLLGFEEKFVSFDVNRKIVNVVLTKPSPTDVRLLVEQDKEHSFRLEIQGGANVTITMNYGDGDAPTVRRIVDVGNETHFETFNHTYSQCAIIELCYQVTSFIGTNFTACIPVDVVCAIENVQVKTIPPASQDTMVYLKAGALFAVEAEIEAGSAVTCGMRTNDTDYEQSPTSSALLPPPVRFQRVFSAKGTYNLTFNCSNLLSSYNTSFRVSVTSCSFPPVALDGSNIASSPMMATTGTQIKIKGYPEVDSDPNCQASGCEYPHWEVLKDSGSGKNFSLFETVTEGKAQPELVLAAGALPAGLYSLSLIQSCNSKTQRYESYVEIVTPPLSCMIENGKLRSVGSQKTLRSGNMTYYNITIDASTSYDPDLAIRSSSTLSFTWFCRRLSNDSVTNMAIAMRSGEVGAPYNGTLCLSPQRTQFDMAFNLDPNRNGVLLLHTSMLLEATYEFEAQVTKGARECAYVQNITLLAGGPPDISLACVSNCKQKYNLQEIGIFSGYCLACGGKQLEYNWCVKEQNMTGCLNKDALLPWNVSSLSLPPGILKENKVYMIEVEVGFKAAAARTKATREVITSDLPKGGVCGMSATEGVCLEDKFNSFCRKWESQDIPLTFCTYIKSYGAASTDAEQLEWKVWHCGSSPDSPAKDIGMGVSAMRVCVRNSFLARTCSPDINVTVTPYVLPEITVVPPDTSAATNGTLPADPVLGLLNSFPADSDNPQQTATFVVAFLSLLPTSSDDTSNASSTTSNEESVGAPDENKLKEEQEKESMQNVNAELISRLSDVKEITDVDTAQQMLNAFEAVTEDPSAVTPESQGKAAESMQNIATSLIALAGSDGGAEQLAAAATTAIKTASNLLFISQKNQENNPDSTNRTANGTLSPETEQNKQTVVALLHAVNDIGTATLKVMVVGGAAFTIETDELEMTMNKFTVEDLEDLVLTSGNTSKINMPSAEELGLIRDDDMPYGPISTTIVSVAENPFTWGVQSEGDISSSTISFDLSQEDGSHIPISNIANPINITITNDQSKMSTNKVGLMYPGQMIVKKQNVKNPESPLLITLYTGDNSNLTAVYTTYIQYGKAPTLTEHDFKFTRSEDGTASIEEGPSGNDTETRKRRSVLTSSPVYRMLNESSMMIMNLTALHYGNATNASLYVGLTYEGDAPPPAFIENEFTDDQIEVRRPVNVSLTVYGPSCSYWDKDKDGWSTEGLTVDPYGTDFYETACRTTHLSAFGGFQVKPEPIPALSLDMLKNGFVLLLTVFIILLLYALALIYTRRSDRRDMDKVGVCPLPDNNPAHAFRYEITVFTGMKRNAGTESNVFFLLAGVKGKTKVRRFEDPKRKIFKKNSADSFVFTNDIDLGNLSHIRVWHDNSKGGWYLRNLCITDLQSGETYNFLCSRWLAVGEDDGQVERMLPASTKEELSDFSYVFATKTRQDLSDAHLWFSIYARPPTSPFTRTQRMSCCLSLLMTTMMASAMFYRVMPKPDPATDNDVNGIKFSWAQVYVSVITTLITVPINVIIVTIFRSAKGKTLPIDKTAARLKTPTAGIADQKHIAVSVEGEAAFDPKKSEAKKAPRRLPHWAIYIGWALVFISVSSSSVMVIIYGMIFGNKTSLDWLASLSISFFQDVIVTQPVKVFMLALFVAAVLKKIDDVATSAASDRNKTLASDEDWLHGQSDPNRVGVELDMKEVQPPDAKILAQMRDLKLKEKKMYGITRELLMYALFVFIALSISYNLRREIAYTQTADLNELFQLKNKDPDDETKTSFRKVISYNDFWPWMEGIMLPVLFPTPWYGGIGAPSQTETFPGRLFLGDINSKLVNGVRLRQVRIEPSSCTKNSQVAQFISSDCLNEYTFIDEEKQDFYYNWTRHYDFPAPVSRQDSPWRYQDWAALDGYPFWGVLNTYFGGGYAVELFPKFPNFKIVENLKRFQWLDRQTRALFIEFSIFNAASNHFTMVTVLFEFPATGGAVHYSSVLTFQLYRYTSGFAFFVIICEVMFTLFILYFAYREFKTIKKTGRSYFKEFWNLIEFSIVMLSFVAAGFYGYRSVLSTQLLEKLPAKKPDRFINFQFAAYWDQTFIYILALIVFFITIKFIKMLRFNRRVSMLQDTLSHALPPLAMFSVVIGIVMFASCLFTRVVFGNSLQGYSDMLKTTASQMSLLLGKFKFAEYEDANRVLGPIFFFAFNIVVNWVLVNMLISIVNDSYEVVCNNVSEQSNDYEMVDFMLDKFKLMVGFGVARRDEMIEDMNYKKEVSFNDEFGKKIRSPPKLDQEELIDEVHTMRWQKAEASVLTTGNYMKENDVDELVSGFLRCIEVYDNQDTSTLASVHKEADL